MGNEVLYHLFSESERGWWGHFREVAVLLKISISEESCGRRRKVKLALPHCWPRFWFCISFIRDEGTLLRERRTYWDFDMLNVTKKYFSIISVISWIQLRFSYIIMHRLSSSTTLLLAKFRLMRKLKSHFWPQNKGKIVKKLRVSCGRGLIN